VGGRAESRRRGERRNFGLVDTYKGIHEHPELSHHEEHTAALLAGELRKSGFTVTERVGKYPDGTQAYGIVAVMQNGPAEAADPCRHGCAAHRGGDGVAYASRVKAKNAAARVGVMHACGHDVHVTTMIGTARALAATKGNGMARRC